MTNVITVKYKKYVTFYDATYHGIKQPERTCTYTQFEVIDMYSNSVLYVFNNGDIVVDWLECLTTLAKNQVDYSIDPEVYVFLKNSKKYNFQPVKDLFFMNDKSSGFDYRVIVDDSIKSMNDLITYYNYKTRHKKLTEILYTN